jgi:phosphopantetheine--protein transferase-like protein
MNEVEKVRSVVSRFFNVPEGEVTESFVFPSERMQSSVARSTLHAALKRLAGVDLSSVFTANTFGQLVNGSPAPESTATRQSHAEQGVLGKAAEGAPAIGIDIEHADNLPAEGDAWSEPFYGEHFTAAEIAYCTRQAEPRLSFCGIWAAKEAAIKCGLFAGARLNEFTVGHDAAGKPDLGSTNSAYARLAGECVISISHSRGTAVAVCAWVPPGNRRALASAEVAPPAPVMSIPAPKQSVQSCDRLLWASILLSVAAIALWVWKLIVS